MQNVDENISTILGIEPAPSEEDKNSIEVIENENNGEDRHSDYETTRSNLYELLYQNQSALQGILEVAKETDAPRAYEVVSQLVKQQADINKDIMDLHLKMKELDAEEKSGPNNVTNALYIGSTAELQKLIKGKKDV